MSNKMLIICYSQSGNTHRVAVEIQRQTQGELCQIYPWQPYPMTYRKLLSQVKKEIHDGYCPRLLPVSCNLQDYDVIFVGTPNWCGTMAPPVAAFLSQNQLSGKNILPFCTHGGGGSGHIEEDIRKICGDAKVCRIFSTIGKGGVHLTQDIGEWLRDNGINC